MTSWRYGWVVGGLLLVSLTPGTRSAAAQYPSQPQVSKDGTAILLQDYASLPLSSKTTGSDPPPINFAGQLARVNFLRSEPANAPQSSSRFFVNDMNRNLYILDKTSRTFTSYINFEEIFPKFNNDPGYVGGLATFAFDPDYADNGKFYTVHTENPNKSGSAVPTNASLPGLNLSGGYTTTEAVNPPTGTAIRQSVLVEWTDTDRNNSTFEGTAREILRVGFTGTAHSVGDLLFNPTAQPGDPDDRNLYIAVGDGGAGELANDKHTIPQRLDALPGKILRITPDVTLRPGDDLSANGRYRIPTTGSDPNPFVSVTLPDLRKEIYAYGFRNPHRMSWDPVSGKLIVTDIGLHSWEEVNIVRRGGNYGYAEREGNEQLFIGGPNNSKTGSRTNPATPFPDPDSLTVPGMAGPVVPVYPVAQYSHVDGDAISSGFVYRGSLMPQLHGKYIFGDITTARLFYCDLADMIAKDDGDRASQAAVHELQVVFDSPSDTPDAGAVNRRLFDSVSDAYAARGGDAPGNSALPGGAQVTIGNDPDGVPYGGGRADIRLAQGGDGEIYILSKSDGMIRRLVAVVPPVIPPRSLNVRVVASADDAEETASGKVLLRRKWLDLVLPPDMAEPP
jgi:Glucose / Sorbosone dehydrogenase